MTLFDQILEATYDPEEHNLDELENMSFQQLMSRSSATDCWRRLKYQMESRDHYMSMHILRQMALAMNLGSEESLRNAGMEELAESLAQYPALRDFLTNPDFTDAAQANHALLEATRDMENEDPVSDARNTIQLIHTSDLEGRDKMPRYDEVRDICPTLSQLRWALPLAFGWKSERALALREGSDDRKLREVDERYRLRFQRDFPMLKPFREAHFVSHCWEEKDDADAYGCQIECLREKFTDVYFVYDYTSFPQHREDRERSDFEARKFGHILDTSNQWIYSVVVLNHERWKTSGWCFYEYLLACARGEVVYDEIRDERFLAFRDWCAASPRLQCQQAVVSLSNEGDLPQRQNYKTLKLLETFQPLWRQFRDHCVFTNGKDDRDKVTELLFTFLNKELDLWTRKTIPFSSELSRERVVVDLLKSDYCVVDLMGSSPIIPHDPPNGESERALHHYFEECVESFVVGLIRFLTKQKQREESARLYQYHLRRLALIASRHPDTAFGIKLQQAFVNLGLRLMFPCRPDFMDPEILMGEVFLSVHKSLVPEFAQQLQKSISDEGFGNGSRLQIMNLNGNVLGSS